MKRVFSLLALWLLCAALAPAFENRSLSNARRAQALLGADVWSRVISLENTGRTAHYPRVTHALVFELVGILWFYTDTDGTQSFSTHRGRLEQDKADFAPLLRDIHRGFTRWTEVAASLTPLPEATGPLLNGCFIDSVANLRQRLMVGADVRRPQLLSYYSRTANQIAGHTVLTYESAAGVHVIDPLDPKRPMLFPREVARTAESLGTAIIGRLLARAIWVPVSEFATTVAARYAGVAGAYDTALN